MSDAICSRPGCTDPSVGKVDSKAPIFKYKPRPGAVGGELIQKPPWGNLLRAPPRSVP